MIDNLLSSEFLARVYVALEDDDARCKAAEVQTMCRAHLPEAIARLLSIASTAPKPRDRRRATAFLMKRLRDVGVDIDSLLAGVAEGPPS